MRANIIFYFIFWKPPYTVEEDRRFYVKNYTRSLRLSAIAEWDVRNAINNQNNNYRGKNPFL